MAAGAAGLGAILPITLAVLLLLMLFVSYWQTEAYPSNAGSYTVARENLGANAGLLAATALMIDYVLNVAVGISAGIGALTSALPQLPPRREALPRPAAHRSRDPRRVSTRCDKLAANFASVVALRQPSRCGADRTEALGAAYWPEVNFRPMVHPITPMINATRMIVAGSANQIIPITTVPIAPMPVQIA
jgi:amino acid transporter